MKHWDVVGLGANSVDYVYLLPGLPRVSGAFAKMRISRQEIVCGGQMATAMCACARLGLRVTYAGVVGTDDNGRRVHRDLEGRGVDLSDLITRDARNQVAVVLVDETTGDRIVLWDRDDGLLMRDEDLPAASIAAARLLHVDDVDQRAAIRAAHLARAAGVPVTSDIDRIASGTEELIAAVTIPILGEHVPSEITGVADPERALRRLRAAHHELLLVTLGERGVLALDGDTVHHVPAFHVEAVDTTGAGDVFRAAFIHARLRRVPVGEMLRFANAAAAVSCTRLGALGGIPSLEEVTALLSSGHSRG